MSFLPKADLLTLEELDRLCSAFIATGVRKLRLTGGEPLVRRGIMTLVASLSRHLASGALDELTLTTNGSQLPKYASELAGRGVKRINVSLDTLDPDKFRAITRWGELDKVLAGIDAAQAAGLNVKINAVALKGVNEDELPELVTGRMDGHGSHADRGDAARRCRRGPARPVSAALDRAGAPRPSATRFTRSITAPAVPRATSRSPRPADGSASSLRSPIISASPATACG